MAVVDSCCWSDYGKKVCLRSVDPENLERESGVSVDQERVMCWTRGFWDDKWQMTKSGDGTRGGLIVMPWRLNYTWQLHGQLECMRSYFCLCENCNA